MKSKLLTQIQEIAKRVKGKKIEKESFGTNPFDPWSAKANIAEDEEEGLTEVEKFGPGYKQSVVDRYYKSKGLDPRHLKRYAKSAKTRSGDFRKWKHDMGIAEDIGDKKEHHKLTPIERFLRYKGLDPNFVSPEKKAALVRSGEFKKWKAANGINEDVNPNPINKKSQNKRPKSPVVNRLVKLARDYHKNQPVGSAGPLSTQESVLHDEPEGTMTRVSERKRELSKSARMIKSLYKYHGMKEDTFDWEKTEKPAKGPTGKQPSILTKDGKGMTKKGSEKIKAAVVMTGGKTMTGQDRDTIEIDPEMKKRPGQTPGTKQEEPQPAK